MIKKSFIVYNSGRSKRLIKRAAFKIAPITIEKVLLNLPFINDCVVVGVPDEEELEIPMAFVELKEEYQEQFDDIKEKIMDKLKEELPDYELPKYILRKDKIPYKNGKQAFKILEEEGNSFVYGLKETKEK